MEHTSDGNSPKAAPDRPDLGKTVLGLAAPTAELRSQLHRLGLLHRVGVSLSAERNRDRLIEMILIEAKTLCNADGGTLYLRDDEEEKGDHDDTLRFAIMRTDSLGIALGGTTGKPVELPPIPLFHQDGRPNLHNVASAAFHQKQTINIADAYEAVGFDFSGTKTFDERQGYRSKSFLTIPLVNSEDRVIAVLQLLNARCRDTGELVAFAEWDQAIVEALASQAAVALDNQMLLDGQKQLLESFIQMIASAIDSKSPYTGGHCERVPELTLLLAEAACEAQEGPFAEFDLSEDEWYELRIAAWLHDCGKVTTPVHVMDKATKLETIFDRIEVVRARYAALEAEAKAAMYESRLAGTPEAEAEAVYQAELATLRDELSFLERVNIGGEFLEDADKARIREISERRVMLRGEEARMLDEDEIANLSIARGTLTNDERLIINGHMVQTIQMLEALPFPRNLIKVPEYAGGHHERMDGKGYPKGLYAGDMSQPARMMAIADVFEALTAQDRPYKKGKTLSEAMRIMGEMKRWNHLDPELLDLFVSSGVYRTYGERFLPPELIDTVDEEALIAIEPKPYDLPSDDERRARWKDFLPEYQSLRRNVMGTARHDE